MHSPRRREFLSSLGTFALLPTVRTEAELVLHNANLLTMDPAQPRAQAVAISGGRFLAVGRDADVLNLATARAARVDLGGRTVVPGFIDAHTHPAAAGYLHLKQIDCALDSIARIQEALRSR
ncbi:MAG TPA: amidohydrolase family protein, partial [Vicinamibacteria bacterium]